MRLKEFYKKISATFKFFFYAHHIDIHERIDKLEDMLVKIDEKLDKKIKNKK